MGCIELPCICVSPLPGPATCWKPVPAGCICCCCCCCCSRLAWPAIACVADALYAIWCMCCVCCCCMASPFVDTSPMLFTLAASGIIACWLCIRACSGSTSAEEQAAQRTQPWDAAALASLLYEVLACLLSTPPTRDAPAPHAQSQTRLFALVELCFYGCVDN